MNLSQGCSFDASSPLLAWRGLLNVRHGNHPMKTKRSHYSSFQQEESTNSTNPTLQSPRQVRVAFGKSTVITKSFHLSHHQVDFVRNKCLENLTIMLSSSLRLVLTSIASKSATGKTVQSMGKKVAMKNREASLSTAQAAAAVVAHPAETRSVVVGKGYSPSSSSSSSTSRIFSTAAAGDCHMTGF